MSDDPFRRPGSGAGAPSFQQISTAAGWQPEAKAVVESAPSAVEAHPVPADAPRHASLVRRSAVFGVAGLLAGLIGGFVFISTSAPSPMDITFDTFPDEVLGRQRDDIVLRAAPSDFETIRPDAKLQEQLANHRFAYGGDGAEFVYGEKYSLTIVNGRIPTILPTKVDEESEDFPWVVSLESADTACVSQDPPQDEEPPFDLNDVLEDDSKDVFFYLERNRTLVHTECVLFDEKRNLSLRLEAEGRVEDIRPDSCHLPDSEGLKQL